MIYEFSNFVDTYSNADGKSQERMAISQFSKILGQTPKTIEVAITDAGIDVPTGASKNQMVDIIRNNIGNRKLKTHLGTLIVAQAQAEGENLNLFGKKADGTSRGGTAFFSKIGGLFKKKNANNPVDGTTPTTGGTEKKGFFKNLFGSRTNEAGEKQPSKFGSWFSKNSDAIGNIGGSLLGGLFGDKGSDDAKEQSTHYQEGAGGTPTTGGKKGGMGKKILIGVAILGVIGGVIYFVRKKK